MLSVVSANTKTKLLRKKGEWDVEEKKPAAYEVVSNETKYF